MGETLDVKPASECRWDAASLGEIMLRLDPGDGRIHTAREFKAWEGGGEYNVVRGLRRCFGMRTTAVTAFADNPVGRLVEDFMLQGGVDVSHVLWRPFDGIGRTVRNGLNFVERGFGCRGARSCADRGLTAVSQLKPGDVDWDALFGGEGVRWFHTGGIFAALSQTTAEVAVEALKAGPEWFSTLNAEYLRRAKVAGQIMDALGAEYDPNGAGLFVFGKLPAESRNDKLSVILREAEASGKTRGEAVSNAILYGAGVFMAPGFIFGHNGDNYIRISLCAPVPKLEKALEKVKAFLQL